MSALSLTTAPAPQPLLVPVPVIRSAPRAVAQRPTPWAEPLFLWFLSRLLVISALAIGGLMLPLTVDLRTDNPHAGPKPDLQQFFRDYAAHPEQFGKKPMLGVSVGGPWSMLAPYVSWDSIWFLSIVEAGYVIRPDLKAQQNLAFFPGYPLLVQGLSATGLHPLLAALVISNLATLLTALALYRLVLRRSGIMAARWAVTAWLFFPTALFGSVAYSDSLLTLCGVLSLSGVLADQPLRAGLWAGLATAVRSPGLALGMALLPGLLGPRRGWYLLGGLLSGLGITAYFSYLWHVSGDPLCYPHIISQWRSTTLGSKGVVVLLIGTLREALLNLRILLQGEPLFLFRSSHVWEPLLVLVCLAWFPSIRQLGWGPLLSTAAMIWLPLSLGGVASFGRYMWAMIPIFVVLGPGLAAWRGRWLWLTASVALLVWLSLLRGGGWEVI